MKLIHLMRCGILGFPTVLCSFSINIYVPITIRDNIKLIGKQFSDGESIEMTDANRGNYGRPDRCHIEPEWIVAEGSICDNKPLFALVTYIDFENPTDDPRPINISMPVEDFWVSHQGTQFRNELS
jgi:hypothetical protein